MEAPIPAHQNELTSEASTCIWPAALWEQQPEAGVQESSDEISLPRAIKPQAAVSSADTGLQSASMHSSSKRPFQLPHFLPGSPASGLALTLVILECLASWLARPHKHKALASATLQEHLLQGAPAVPFPLVDGHTGLLCAGKWDLQTVPPLPTVSCLWASASSGSQWHHLQLHR